MSRESSSRGRAFRSPDLQSQPDDIYQEIHVDPRFGLIRLNKPYGSWRRVATANRKRETAEISTRRRVIDGRTL